MIKMNQKRWSSVGLFIMVLVISMPFYSANVLASTISITRNTGSAGVEDYIDANGDIWDLEVLITDAVAPVTADSVVLQVGQTENEFNSCSSSALGTSCSLITPLTDGVPADSYSFTVQYSSSDPLTGITDSAARTSVINADGNSPLVSGLTVSQTGSDVSLSFIVQDPGSPAVGLAEVEIIDADNNVVLQTIPLDGEISFDFVNDGGSSGILETALTGEGLRRIKVRASDLLGHTTTSNARSFRTDFVPPVIDIGSIEYTKLGRFIGAVSTTTNIVLDIIEDNDLVSVTASSNQASLQDTVANCQLDNDQVGLWHCTWSNVLVNPATTISLDVVAKDNFGNSAPSTVPKTFIPDLDKPVIEYFGSVRQYLGENYVKADDNNRIFLEVSDQGVGIVKEDIEANMKGFGKGDKDSPTFCEEDDDGLITGKCYWDVGKPSSGARKIPVNIRKLQDKVGNDNSGQEVSFNVDNNGPRVREMAVFGGSKNYFASGDSLKIELTVEEDSGLTILVNLDGLVDSAVVNYPEEELTRDLGDGWRVYTEEDGSCNRNQDGQWECTILTEELMSGTGNSKDLEILVRDTAGNDAEDWPADVKNVDSGSNGNYKFTLLGLDVGEDPDYWGVDRIRLLTPFVDLDTARLFPTRAYAEVTLKSSEQRAEILSIDLLDCELSEGEGPEINRNLIYGGLGERRVKTNFVLEFEPFEPKEVFEIENKKTFTQKEAEYTCELVIRSRIGANALANSELQEVKIKVPFAFSKLGSIDENLGLRINELKDDFLFEISGFVGTLDEIFAWVRYLNSIVNIIDNILDLYILVSSSLIVSAEAYETTAIGTVVFSPLAGLGGVIRGACATIDASKKPVWDLIQYVQIPIQIMSCDPRAGDTLGKVFQDVDFSSHWYFGFQKLALDTYNLASGRILLPEDQQATSLYDNLYTSIMGLCVPGLIYNAKKASEIKCRQVICYGRDVPAGLATISACDELYGLQMCEFVLGPALQFFPLTGIATYIGNLIKSLFSSPIGLAMTAADALTCGFLCFAKTPPGPGLLIACNISKGANAVTGIINSVVSAVSFRPDVTETRFCDEAKEINIEDLVTVSEEEEPVEEVEEV